MALKEWGEGAASRGAGGTAGPTPGGARIRELDLLRGFALTGVLLVNLRFMGTPELYWGHEEVARRWPGFLDRAAAWLIQAFVVAKFLSLFSFLFGLGFALMMRRIEERGASFTPLYSRRLLALLGFGLLHSFLIWYGDILATYAVLGFLLLAFRRRPEGSLLRWAAVGLLVPVLLAAGAAALGSGGSRPEEGEADRAAAMAQQSIRAYGSGDAAEIFAQRVRDVARACSETAPFFTFNFALFLLGLYAGRRRLFEDLAGLLPMMRRLRLWGLLLGVSCSFLAILALRRLGPEAAFLGVLSFVVGTPALAFFYGTSLLLLARRERWDRWLAPLAAVGRTALTNYLLQSVIGTTLFYSYGLALYGRVGPAAGLLLAAGIYALEMGLSVWWLRRFRFGPAEWLWRSLTYWKVQPILARP